jgi:hypothetical protein
LSSVFWRHAGNSTCIIIRVCRFLGNNTTFISFTEKQYILMYIDILLLLLLLLFDAAYRF